MTPQPNKRDPRTDPRPGDVVIFGPQWQRERVEVTAADGDIVRGLMNGQVVIYTRRQWEAWMEGAEVLYVAD